MRMKLPNGMGGVSKLSGKRRNPYIVRKTIGFDENGKQLFKIIGYYSKYQEAMTALINYNETPIQEEKIKRTFQSVYEAFCEDKYTKHDKSIPHTYSAPYKRLKPLYDVDIDDITVTQLIEMQNNQPTPATKRDMKTLLNQVYKFAIKLELTDRNPASALDNQKIEKSTLHKPFTDDELKMLWNWSNDVRVRYWLIYIYTGLRPSELVLIKNEDVHLDENYMTGGIKNDYSKNRIIPIADCIKPFIKDLYNPNENYLINDNGQPYSYERMKNELVDMCGELNMTHLPHDGRHSFATYLHRLKTDILVIQKILGQSPQTIAGKVYIHIVLPDMLKAVNQMPHFAG